MKFVGNIASDSEVVATADGAITAGKPVVVNADGTVKFAGQATVTTTVGSATTFDSNAITSTDITFDSSNNKVVVSFQSGRTGDYGVARVGTVDASNNTISFGTETVFESAAVYYTSIDFDSTNNKVLIVYRDNGNSQYGTAIVGTVSGTDISFGSPTVFESAQTDYITTRFDPDNSKFLIVYKDVGNSNYGTAIVATISGTSVSFGSPTVYRSGQVDFNSCIYDTNANKFLVTYRNFGASGDGIVGTISGTSVSFGSATAFHSSGSTIYVNGTDQRYGMSFDSTANKILIAYIAYISSSIGYVVVGTISGTSVSFGSYVALGSALENERNEVAYDSNTNKHLLMTSDLTGSDTDGSDITNVREVTISGTTPTVGSKVLVSDLRESTNNALVFDSNAKKIVMAYSFGGNSNYGTANVVQTSGTVNSLTSENFIGFAKDNVADGAVATIQTANSIARDSIGEPITLSGGTAAVFESANTTLLASTFDSSNNKIVIAYRDNGNSEYGTAIVGTVSGTDITFGSPTVFESASIGFMGEDSIVFDSNANKVVIVYEDEGNSQYGTAIVGTVSGTSISFGSPTVFESAACFDISAVFDSSNNKIVVAYEDQGNSEHGTAIVGTVSGTSISFGSPTVFNAGETLNIETTFDSTNNKVVIAFTDAGNSNQGTAIVGTVSGTSISFGSEAVFDTSTGSKVGQGKSSITFDSNQNKVLVSYVDVGDSEHGKAIVGTVSGTSISFGTASTFESATTSELSSAFDSDAKAVVIAYKDEGNSSYGTAITASISGTSVSFGTPVAYKTSRADEVSITYDSSNNKTVAAFGDVGNSEYGTAVVISADSSLTIGQTYFVQTDGTLSTSADDPSVIAGTAISGTDLIVKG